MQPLEPSLDAELRAAARQLGRRLDCADDLAQEARLAALRTEDIPRDRRRWVLRVVRHRAVDASRVAANRDRREQATARSIVVDTDADRTLVRSEVVDAIDRLPSRLRIVVLLRFMQDLPPREIAARLGLSVRSVDGRLLRAKELLRKRLTPAYAHDRSWRARAGALLASTGVFTVKKILAAGVVIVVSLLAWSGFTAPSPTSTPTEIPTSEARSRPEREAADDAKPRGIVTAAWSEPTAPGPNTTILVLDETGEPLPGVEVRGETATVGLLRRLEVNGILSMPTRVAGAPTLGVTDSRGRLTVHVPSTGLDVHVRHGKQEATELIDPGGTDSEPELVELSSLPPRVQFVVRDEAGHPVPDAEVELIAHRSAFWRRRTDDQGRVTAQRVLAGLRGTPLVHARVNVPGNERRPVKVTLAPAPRTPVELRIAPVAAIDVSIVGTDGGTPAGPFLVSVRVVRADDDHEGLLPHDLQNRDYAFRFTNGAAVSFPCVEPEQRLRIDVRGIGNGLAAGHAIVRSGAAGTRSAARIVVPAGTTVTARLVDEDGRPLAPCDFEVRTRGNRPMAEPFDLDVSPTTPDGSVRFMLDPPSPRTGPRAIRFHGEKGRESIWVDVPLDVTTHDAGDVVMSDDPVAVSGLVVGPTGLPARGARVSAGREDPADGWIWVHGVSIDESGRFEVRGPSDKRYQVTAYDKRANLGPTTLEFPGGTRDARIVLSPAPILTGRVLLDRPEDARVTLRVKGGSIASRTLPPDGSFRFRGITPGTGTIAVEVHGCRVAVVKDVRIDSARVTDPRLSPLDLRGRISELRIRLVDEDGDPLLNQTVCLVTDRGRRFRRSDGQGYVEAAWPEAITTAALLAPGRTGRRIEITDDGRDVRMDGGRRVRFDVTSTPPAGWVLEWNLRSSDALVWRDADAWASSPTASWPPVEMALGRWEIRWRLRHAESREIGRGPTGSTTIVIEEGDDVQTIRIAPPAEVLDVPK